jgi:HK97 gp10 family phage protein
MRFEYKVSDEKVIQAFRQAAPTMAANLRVGLDRAAMTMVQAARDELRANDSLAFSTLLNSIAYTRVGNYEREVSPNADYAIYLEKGTKPGYYPPTFPIVGWLKARGAADPERTAFRVKKHIFRAGTKAQPFWQPAYEQAEPKMRQIIEEYVARGVARAFGGA